MFNKMKWCEGKKNFLFKFNFPTLSNKILKCRFNYAKHINLVVVYTIFEEIIQISQFFFLSKHIILMCLIFFF